MGALLAFRDVVLKSGISPFAKPDNEPYKQPTPSR